MAAAGGAVEGGEFGIVGLVDIGVGGQQQPDAALAGVEGGLVEGGVPEKVSSVDVDALGDALPHRRVPAVPSSVPQRVFSLLHGAARCFA